VNARKEIASKSALEVRNDERLMRLYIEEYKGVFGYEPNCVPCTFDRDFRKFKQAINRNTKNNLTMENTKTTFQLHPKHKNSILTYIDGKQVKRLYGYRATEEFVLAYLSIGTDEQIEARKKQFLVLPKASKPISNALVPVKEVSAVENEEKPLENDDISVELARKYKSVFGKKVYYPWGAKKVEAMIAEHSKQEE